MYDLIVNGFKIVIPYSDKKYVLHTICAIANARASSVSIEDGVVTVRGRYYGVLKEMKSSFNP